MLDRESDVGSTVKFIRVSLPPAEYNKPISTLAPDLSLAIRCDAIESQQSRPSVHCCLSLKGGLGYGNAKFLQDG